MLQTTYQQCPACEGTGLRNANSQINDPTLTRDDLCAKCEGLGKIEVDPKLVHKNVLPNDPPLLRELTRISHPVDNYNYWRTDQHYDPTKPIYVYMEGIGSNFERVQVRQLHDGFFIDTPTFVVNPRVLIVYQIYEAK